MRELQRFDVSERIDAEWRGLHARGLHAGALAAASWLSSHCLCATAGGWEVSVVLAATNGAADTRFHFAVSANEWGFYFCHGGRQSWIRVTDVPFVHERDDFDLVREVP